MNTAAKVDLREFQQALASRLADATPGRAESSRLGVLCAGEHWLIRLGDAAEVTAVPPMVAVPLTRRWFAGIANIRGNLHSIVDLARFLGRDGDPGSAAQHRVILFAPRAGELRVGIIVQRVLGLRNVNELAPVAAPAGAPSWWGARWMDAAGNTWQELDLADLARDAAFLSPGL